MEIKIEKRLFWFLKDNTSLNLEDESILDMYVQQVLMRGQFRDVKELLKNISFSRFKSSFTRIKQFIPKGIREFWEEYFANFKQNSDRHS